MTKATARWRKWTAQFRVSLGWAKKISARGRGTGQVDAPIWWHGPVSRVTPGVQEWIRKQVPTQPHMTLQKLRAQLEEAQQVYLSMGRMWLALCQLGLPLKRRSTRTSGESEPAQRQVWREAIAELDVEQLIFLDESGATTQMTRGHARAPRGQRSKKPRRRASMSRQ